MGREAIGVLFKDKACKPWSAAAATTIHKASTKAPLTHSLNLIKNRTNAGRSVLVRAQQRPNTSVLILTSFPTGSHGSQRPRPRDPHTTAEMGQKIDREGVEGTQSSSFRRVQPATNVLNKRLADPHCQASPQAHKDQIGTKDRCNWIS